MSIQFSAVFIPNTPKNLNRAKVCGLRAKKPTEEQIGTFLVDEYQTRFHRKKGLIKGNDWQYVIHRIANGLIKEIDDDKEAEETSLMADEKKGTFLVGRKPDKTLANEYKKMGYEAEIIPDRAIKLTNQFWVGNTIRSIVQLRATALIQSYNDALTTLRIANETA